MDELELQNRSMNVFTYAGTLGQRGGVESHILRWGALMAGRGHRLGIFYTRVRERDLMSTLPPGASAFDLGIGSGVKRALQSVAKALPFRGKADIYYSNNNGLINVVVGWILRPQIWVHHHHLNYEAGDFKKWTVLERWQLRRATHIIMCSPVHAERMAADLGNCVPIFVPYLKSEGTGLASLGSGATRRLGYFGLLRRAKGLPFLLKLGPWLQRNELTLRIHGRDEEDFRKAVLHANIELYGEYDQATDLDALFRQVGLTVVASEEGEGLPLVISESLSRGVPVVAFRFAGISWLKDEIPGLRIVEPGDCEGYRTAAIELLKKTGDLFFRETIRAAYLQKLGNQICEGWWERCGPRSVEVERQ